MTTPADVPATPKQLRAAQLAYVLAKAVREGDLNPVDALRVIRHEMRGLNTNKKLSIPRKSVEAQQVIAKYAHLGTVPPRNDSDEALHADHVHAITADDLATTRSLSDWLVRLAELQEVVCVTARENYHLEVLERQGWTGWEKYERAGIEFVQPPSD